MRDADGALKRQAARFRLFAYNIDGPDSYPNGGGTEVVLGPLPDGRIPGETNIAVPLMPLSVGDAGKAFLTVTKTQYFFLECCCDAVHRIGRRVVACIAQQYGG